MSTFTIDSATSRATPDAGARQAHDRAGAPGAQSRTATTEQPIVMLTAYTMRMAQLLDPHCDMLLVGDSLGQVIYGLPSTIPVTLEMMCAHGAAVVRGSWHALVAVDMPFGSYEGSPEQAFASASRVMKETGCAAVKLEGGEAMAPTIAFLTQRGIPVIGHVGLTPQAVNVLGGYGARGPGARPKPTRSCATRARSTEAGAFCIVVEGVLEDIATEVTDERGRAGDRHRRLGRMRRAGAGDRGHARPVRAHAAVRETLRRPCDPHRRGGGTYADEVRARTFPTADQTYRPKALMRLCLCAFKPARRALRRQLPFIQGGEGSSRHDIP